MKNNQLSREEVLVEIQLVAVRGFFAEVKNLLVNAGLLVLLSGAVLYLGLSFLIFIAPAFIWGIVEAGIKIFAADRIVQNPENNLRVAEVRAGN